MSNIESQLTDIGTTYTHEQTWAASERQEVWYWAWDMDRDVALIRCNGENFAAISSEEHLEELDLPEEMQFLLALYIRKRTS